MKVICFGDFLMHFSTEGYDRFFQTDRVRMTFTGAEANVAMALGLWGADAEFVTRLPDNLLAEKAVASLRQCHVRTEHIATGGSRMGIYFLEKGAAVRPSTVIYDRWNSGFTEAAFNDYDWDGIFDGAEYFFVTGITPSLCEHTASVTLRALQEAHRRGVKAFYDANFRSSLTTAEHAGELLHQFAPFLHGLIINEEHARMLLGIAIRYGEDEAEQRLRDVTDQIRTLTGISQIAVTVRRTISATDTVIYDSFSDGDNFAVSRAYPLHVVDRVGSGDAFTAGILYNLLQGSDTARTVNWAAASNAIKHTVNGDVNYCSVGEIDSVMNQTARDVRR